MMIVLFCHAYQMLADT